MIVDSEDKSFFDATLVKKVSPETYDSILKARQEGPGYGTICLEIIAIILLGFFL